MLKSVHQTLCASHRSDGQQNKGFHLLDLEAGDGESRHHHRAAQGLQQHAKSMGMGMGTDDPAKERAIEMLAIAKRVRLVGALIAADKILVILLYVVILIHGMIAWLKPEMINAPFGIYAIFDLWDTQVRTQ
ncbi:hypothetical protein HKX48_007271 [Thoreauomyces humboldtii]|nr:hypothetical protein HKX48_007271 [Thoreauomyces humboldtii]